MAKWNLINEFTAARSNDDGTFDEKKFTSHAQARQFVEQQTGEILAFKHKPMMPQHQIANRAWRPLRDSELTADQKKLKQEALKQFKGL